MNEKVLESVTAIMGMANQTVGEVNEIAAFITEMRDQVESLRQEMSNFNVGHADEEEMEVVEEAIIIPVSC